MARPGKMKEIEEREKKPIKQILIDAYLRHGEQKVVADALGVSQTTISLWLMRLGLKQRVILVPVDRDRERAG
jgi:transcriptional regulator with PAS, ATPase and Fis domain